MLWVEVDLQTWFRRCMPETKPLPIGTRFDAPEVVLDGRERVMYPGLNVAFNSYLETIGCTAFTTRCTATRKAEVTAHATNASDRLAVHGGSCPDLVIFPTHGEAAKTYRLTNDDTVEHCDAAHDEASNGLVPGSEESRPPPAPVPVMPEGGSAPPSPSPVSDDPLAKATHAKMSWHWAEVVVEVKHSTEWFPFMPNDFLPQGKKSRISRGQITHHAAQIAATQHRQSVLLVLILKGDARLLRFDRNGAAVSEPFDYVSHPEIIGEFLYRAFCSPESKAEACRGHDPTAKPAALADAEFFRALHERYDQGSTVAKALKRAASDGWPIYELDVHGIWSEDGAAPLNHTSPRSLSTHRCLVGRPEYASSSMVGRGTKCFVAWDLQLRQPLLIKDTWRPTR
ncbi:hypothetical protein OH76DRAFT_1480526 [Lentinus brumalis]|uniref:Uncharacterized protein n=1 Tax=Lentinus brumalis TaxID=2498619 RepID=A0A371DIM6_9APHY|nr:hypothetical protein OH76DRAFT_1480526 [Polyporus brumalis]